MLQSVLVLFLLVIPTTTAFAQSIDPAPPMLTKPEKEVVRICEEMQKAYDEYYDQAEMIKDESERARYYNEKDPSSKYVAQLINLERENHGTSAGLMAARKLVLLGASGGRIGNPRDAGRRHALIALPDYANQAVLPEIIRYVASGNVEPVTESMLRKLMSTPEAGDQNRLFASYMLARWVLRIRDGKEYQEQRLKEIAGGSPLRYPTERDQLSESLAQALASEKLAALEQEALQILETLAKSDSSAQQPGVANVDKDWYVIRVDPEKAKSMPRVKDLAAGVLFKEQHLRVGQPAPDLKVKLVSGNEWSLAEQRGKTVVIQFSFKGCGPCEEMYPDLRAMLDEYKGKLTIIGVMADEKREDAAEAVSSGKLTWDVCWDGSRGPIATKWAVTGFPTVYVIGPDGQVAATDLRGERLRAKVAELTR